MWMWRNESSTKSEKHNHTYFSFSWFYRETSFTIIFMFRLQTERAVWGVEGREAATIDSWKCSSPNWMKCWRGRVGWEKVRGVGGDQGEKSLKFILFESLWIALWLNNKLFFCIFYILIPVYYLRWQQSLPSTEMKWRQGFVDCHRVSCKEILTLNHNLETRHSWMRVDEVNLTKL